MARRLEKCRAAAAEAARKPKLAARAREKALGVLNLVSAWDGSPGSRGSLPLPPLLDAACRALWVLETRAEEAELVLSTVLPRIHSLAERAHGVKSAQAAGVLALLTRRAYDADEHLQAVRWGRPAAALLLELKGERFDVPEAARRKEGFMDAWDSAPNLHLCEDSHCDMLCVEARAPPRWGAALPTRARTMPHPAFFTKNAPPTATTWRTRTRTWLGRRSSPTPRRTATWPCWRRSTGTCVGNRRPPPPLLLP